MGYFANGTEGVLYYERYCDRCIHEQDGRQCAVWLAHLVHNYAECNKDDSILHRLIPRDDLGNNRQCEMFIVSVLTANAEVSR